MGDFGEQHTYGTISLVCGGANIAHSLVARLERQQPKCGIPECQNGICSPWDFGKGAKCCCCCSSSFGNERFTDKTPSQRRHTGHESGSERQRFFTGQKTL